LSIAASAVAPRKSKTVEMAPKLAFCAPRLCNLAWIEKFLNVLDSVLIESGLLAEAVELVRDLDADAESAVEILIIAEIRDSLGKAACGAHPMTITAAPSAA
jgi:hypothetical protein